MAESSLSRLNNRSIETAKAAQRNSETGIKMAKTKITDQPLQGWQAIAGFLSQPVAVAQRWAREAGMPVSRQGRYVVASPEELNRWLGRESGEPVQIATESTDLMANLRRGLSYVREQRQHKSQKATTKSKR